MLKGQVGVLTKNPGWYGREVQLFTASPAYHTVWAISETQIVSVEVPRVVLRPIDYYPDVQWTNETFESDAALEQAVHFAKLQVGKKYAYFDIALLAIAAILKTKTPDWILNRVDDTRRWFCSELCDAVMIIAGVNMFPGRPACTVTPKDFLDAIQEKG